jgi:hypothetical protein
MRIVSGLARAPHRSRLRQYAISLCADGRVTGTGPASRYQPDDVHGPSEVVDPSAHVWHDAGRSGRPRAAHRRLYTRRYLQCCNPQARPLGCARWLPRSRSRQSVTSRSTELGLRRHAALHARQFLWPTRGLEGPGRGGPQPQADDAARCRVQPFRPGGRPCPRHRAENLHDRYKTRGARQSISTRYTAGRFVHS